MTIDELTPINVTTAPGSYAEGEAEFETIAKAIEHGEIVIDKLSLAVKRADFLNRHLEQQLVGIEEDLKQLGQQGKTPNDPKP
jgi:exonuclease VII small subunit